MRDLKHIQKRTRQLALALALGFCLTGAVWAEEGVLPRLELVPMPPTEEITPIADLVKGLPATQESKPQSRSEKPAAPKAASTVPSESAPLPAEQAPAQPTPAETPAVNTRPQVSNEHQHLKPVSYSPLPAIAIFPVVRHGQERAFGDLPLMFAREYAQRMELKAPETKVYHPVYSVDELRLRGLGHVYDQIMEYYKKAGRPEPMAMDYLLKQLADDGRPVARVIFVEANLDMANPTQATGLFDRLNAWMTDATPKQMKYMVRSRMQAFDAENPEFPMVWAGSWNRSIKADRFYNVTPSVYEDSDSQQAFAKLSRQMSREVLFVTPQEVYMAPQYDTAVQGELVSKKEQPFPNFTELKQPKSRMSDENMQAIQRILRRQNGVSP